MCTHALCQGPGTVHVYTELWAEHSQEYSKNIGMSVDLKSFAVTGYLSEQNILLPKLSRPKHIPACMSVFVYDLLCAQHFFPEFTST